MSTLVLNRHCKHEILFVGFELIRATSMKSGAFRDFMACNPAGVRLRLLPSSVSKTKLSSLRQSFGCSAF
jgi:hypothetical protein